MILTKMHAENSYNMNLNYITFFIIFWNKIYRLLLIIKNLILF